jgi:hypothetical protein
VRHRLTASGIVFRRFSLQRHWDRFEK